MELYMAPIKRYKFLVVVIFFCALLGLRLVDRGRTIFLLERSIANPFISYLDITDVLVGIEITVEIS